MRQQPYLLLMLLTACQFVYADSPLSLDGRGELETLNMRENADPDNNQQITLDMKVNADISDSLSFKSDLRARHNENLDEKSVFISREAYIAGNTSVADIKVGQQIFAWGRSDIVNAADFSRRNYLDPLDDDAEKLGNLAISAKFYRESYSVEPLLIPVYQASELPAVNAPWALLQDSPGIHYKVADEQPDNNLANLQYGVRVDAQFTGIDAGFSFFNGWNDIPSYQAEMQLSPSGALVTLHAQPYRIRTYAADMAYLLGSYSGRAELTYIQTQDSAARNPQIDDPYYHLVLGLDKQISNALQDIDAFMLLEWSHQFKTSDIQYQISDLDHIFENTVFVRARLERASQWQLKLDLAYDVENDGYFIRPGLKNEWSDVLSSELQLEWLNGPDNSFFGYFKRNSAVRFRLDYRFGN